MELYFCDLCQEAVPHADLQKGAATQAGERVVCRSCHDAMGRTASDSKARLVSRSSADGSIEPDALAGVPAGDGGAGGGAPRRGRPLVSPGLGAVLAISSIVLTLFAVIALLVRVELISKRWSGDFELAADRIHELEERNAGTRDMMVRAARTAGADAVSAEFARLDSIERQLAELRQLLVGAPAGEADVAAADGALPERRAPLLEQGLVLPGDALERVDELEQQLLFLQARVYELLESDARVAMGQQPVERLELPEGEVGQLIAQLSHEDPIERVAALYSLALVDDPGIVGHVTALLKDDDAYIRALSARILQRLDARSAVQSLIDSLADPEVAVREAAVGALRSITARQFAYDPRGPSGDRYAAAKKWRGWWKENWKTFLYRGE